MAKLSSLHMAILSSTIEKSRLDTSIEKKQKNLEKLQSQITRLSSTVDETKMQEVDDLIDNLNTCKEKIRVKLKILPQIQKKESRLVKVATQIGILQKEKPREKSQRIEGDLNILEDERNHITPLSCF